MSVNIYVGNISYDMTETQLKDLFSQHGEVVSAKIISDQFSGKSKGFGFIEMTDKNDANSAIQQLDGTSVQNRNIKVNLAKPRSEGPRQNRY